MTIVWDQMHLVGGPLVAMLAAYLICPKLIQWMTAWKLLDAPDGVRKLHGRSVPLAGGFSVLFGLLLAIAAGLLVQQSIIQQKADATFVLTFSMVCVGITLLGLQDDRGRLRGRQKLLGQTIAALVLTYVSSHFERLEFLDMHLELGFMAVPFTVFWLVGAINAVNLIDGVDGLATTVGGILSATFAVMAFQTNHSLEAMIGACMAGALLGFLPSNFPRAKMFLGDTGSMLIGLVLGVLALRTSVKSQATLALAAPLAVLSVLIFDVMMAILRRKLTGRSLYSTDRGHLHHRLAQMGYSPTGVVLVIGTACLICCATGIASIQWKNEWIAIGGSSLVLACSVAAKIFGHTEVGLLFQRLLGFARSFFPSNGTYTPGAHAASQLQGTINWKPLWIRFLDVGDTLDAIYLEFHINSARLHEHYHASWTRKTHEASDTLWKLTIPLVFEGQVIGRLALHGTHESAIAGQMSREMVPILKAIEPIEKAVTESIEKSLHPQTVSASEPLAVAQMN